MSQPLRWAVGVAALSLVAVIAGRLMPLVGALLAALTAPGIIVALYEVLRATDGPTDAETRRSVFVALGLLALSVLVILWSALFVPATG